MKMDYLAPLVDGLTTMLHRREQKPIEHYVDGREAWKNELAGLLRGRGLAVAGAIILAFLILLHLLSHFVPILLHPIPTVYVLTLLVSFFFIGVIYLRRRSIRSLHIKHQLHRIAYAIRERYVTINSNNDKNNFDIESISNGFCNLIQRYFALLTNKDRIAVAIRIARKVGDKVAYVTVGREGLNLRRANTSEPLYADEGLAKILNDPRGGQGVLIINDIEKAATIGAFKKQRNDADYPDDYVAMMVSPIIGWDGTSKGMLGILYVTAKDRGIFREKHTDAMGFVSASLANVYSELLKTQLTGDANEPLSFRKTYA